MAPKAVVKTTVPYSEPTWPALSPAHQAIILDLLCSLLEPLGAHRSAHTTPSAGKSRTQRRKRKRAATEAHHHDDEGTGPPPAPDIGRHVLVGLNSVTRHLSALAAHSAPLSVPAAQKLKLESDAAADADAATDTDAKPPSPPRPLSLVILPHPSPPSSLPHAHLPTLVYLASRNSSTHPPTRLVALPTASESRLASTLSLPRVGALAIMEGAPGAAILVDFVRTHVGPVECRWLEESLQPGWTGVKTSV